jgi:hypothetical protein
MSIVNLATVCWAVQLLMAPALAFGDPSSTSQRIAISWSVMRASAMTRVLKGKTDPKRFPCKGDSLRPLGTGRSEKQVVLPRRTRSCVNHHDCVGRHSPDRSLKCMVNGDGLTSPPPLPVLTPPQACPPRLGLSIARVERGTKSCGMRDNTSRLGTTSNIPDAGTKSHKDSLLPAHVGLKRVFEFLSTV